MASSASQVLSRYITRSATNERGSTEIHLSRDLKLRYTEIVPMLSGRGNRSSITLLGRRRDNPSKLDKILSRPWEQGDAINIIWDGVAG